MDSVGGSGRSSGSGSGYNSYQSFGKRKRSAGATVKARGLPFSTNEYDLVEFFSDFNVSMSILKVH